VLITFTLAPGAVDAGIAVDLNFPTIQFPVKTLLAMLDLAIATRL
jgi:hypothetical protein